MKGPAVSTSWSTVVVPCNLAPAFLVLSLVVASACSRHEPGKAPLPKLPETVELSVVHVINPRLPAFSEAQVGLLLAQATRGIEEHFDKKVVFGPAKNVQLSAYLDLARLREEHRKGVASNLYDFKGGTGERYKMAKAFAENMRVARVDLNEAIGYAAPHMDVLIRGRGYQDLADALVTTQLSRLDEWRATKANDGGPLLDDTPANEILYWEAMVQAGYPADVILTNQILAGAEYSDNSIHSALRGGLSNGITAGNPAVAYKATAIVSTYAVSSKDATTRKLRGGEDYPDEEAARYAALILVHEAGHQLFHFNHPYSVSACVMSPTPMLRFRAWAQGLSPAACRQAGAKAMERGAVDISCFECRD